MALFDGPQQHEADPPVMAYWFEGDRTLHLGRDCPELELALRRRRHRQASDDPPLLSCNLADAEAAPRPSREVTRCRACVLVPCTNCGVGVCPAGPEFWVHETTGVMECDLAELAKRGYPDEGYVACPEHYEDGSIVTLPARESRR